MRVNPSFLLSQVHWRENGVYTGGAPPFKTFVLISIRHFRYGDRDMTIITRKF